MSKLLRWPALRERLGLPLILTVVSFLGWSGWVVLRAPRHPYNDFGNGTYSDHFSHMNVARTLPSAGADIWRRPAQDMYRPLTRQEIARLPADLLHRPARKAPFLYVPGWDPDKPFVQSWIEKPRMYPPGFLIPVGAVAIAYHFTDLSFYEANRLLILCFLLLAHVSLYFVFDRCFAIEDQRRVWWFLPFFILYAEIIQWTLEGFYDAMAIAPLLLCARYLDERRGLAAVIAFCAASATHFRALLFAPWVLYAVWIIVRERQWRGWGRMQVAGIGVAALLAGATLYPLALLSPVLQHMGSNNPLGNGPNPANVAAITAFLIVLGVCALPLAWARAWIDLAVLAWISLFMLTVREAYSWHILLALPWLAAPVIGGIPARASTVREARFAALLWIALVIYKNPLVPVWLPRLFT